MTVALEAKQDLLDLPSRKLTEFIQNLGLPAFRARQVFPWLYRPGIHSFTQMTDLSKDIQCLLAEQAIISRLQPAKIETSDDGTKKYAFRLADDAIIESVLIPEEDRNTLCISSQVGCAMGCIFCLTGKLGFRRNLTVSEIVNQVRAVRDDPAIPEKGGINNIVFMGMGEPLANFDHVCEAIEILTDQRGLNFSSRRVTVSTCGLTPKINILGEKTKVNLAISLHSANNDVRSHLMPISKTYPLDALLEACRHYPLPKRKRIMIEYILIDGLNDSAAHARELVKKLHGLRCKINLLPFNESAAMPDLRRSSPQTVQAFQDILCQADYTVMVRNSRGADISAACGQLAGSCTTGESDGSTTK